MLTDTVVIRTLGKVHYKGWQFIATPVKRPGVLVTREPTGQEVEGPEGWLFHAWFKDADGTGWTTRKWYLSIHATEAELVQTLLKLVLTAEEHEAREAFLYEGEAIFGPHFNLDELKTVSTVHRADITKQ